MSARGSRGYGGPSRARPRLRGHFRAARPSFPPDSAHGPALAPDAYRTHHFESEEYQSKLHHKVIISGLVAVLATSFNFSEAANHNQEQFLVTNDKALVAAMTAIFDGFFAMTTKSLVDEVLRRNGFLKDGGEDDLKTGDQYDHVDEEAGRSRRKK